MKDLMKMMFIPIVGCVAIAILFVLVVYGGHWENAPAFDNPDRVEGSAVKDLGLYEGYFAVTDECDPLTYRPVCGIDGVTYDNACYAVNAGTGVAYLGTCGSR